MAFRLDYFDMSADGDGVPQQLTEPILVPTLHVSGVQVNEDGTEVRLLFWDSMPMIGSATEHRTAGRVAMNRAAAHDMWTQLGAIFAQGH